jgi:hypothetical protein
VQDTQKEKLSAKECDCGNVEVWWNKIKKCVLHTMIDLDGKIDRKARKPLITQETVNKMVEQKKFKNVKNTYGRKTCRTLKE